MFLDESNPSDHVLNEQLADRDYLLYESRGIDRLTWLDEENRREIRISDQAGLASDIPKEIGVLSEMTDLPQTLKEIVELGLTKPNPGRQRQRISSARSVMAERGILNRTGYGEYDLAVDIPYNGLEEVAERYQIIKEDNITGNPRYYIERGEMNG